MTNQKIKHLTKEGYAKLKKELEDRKTKIRKEIADRIDAARRLGDLSENSAYKAALEDRTINEKTIKDLEDVLSDAEIISGTTNGKISLGSHVTVKIDNREIKYRIVGATEADPAEMAISNESPIGAALIDKVVGEAVSVTLPSGEQEMKILKVE